MAQTNANLIWKIADLLRGPYQPNQYGDVILPFTILRRLDCILEPKKDDVLAEYKKIAKTKVDPDVMLKAKFKLPFYNTSRWSFSSLIGDPEGVADNLVDYIEHFSPNVRDVFDGFRMTDQIADLAKSDRLYLIVKEFAAVDLHPKVISGHAMGHIFEELIRKFAESNSTQAGDHFTPREVIELMVDLLFLTQDEALTKPGTVRTIYDPAAGTGGMLSTAYDHLVEMNPKARPVLYGQDVNPRSYALCKSDMIIKGQDVDNIYLGDTLTDDGFRTKHFDFLLSNPPFGVAWNTQQKSVSDEFEQRGFAGRFGPGLPRVSDGSLLFLLHLISKMQPVKNGEGGSRLAIVLNGSPLFTGGAGSGESNIRQWIIENDLLDAIIALPTDMFYNTGIATYIWILDNNKPVRRKGKIQLINAVEMYGKMQKSLGSKRKALRAKDIKRICDLYDSFTNQQTSDGHQAHSKIFKSDEFGYTAITVERPLRLRFTPTDDKIKQILGKKGVDKLKDVEKGAIRKAVSELIGREWKDSDGFITELKDSLRTAGLAKPSASLIKTIWSTIGEHDDGAMVVTDAKCNREANPALRDTENVPLTEDIEQYFVREVLPHAPDAWIDHAKTRVGYEIPFTRYFYCGTAPRPIADIQKGLQTIVADIQAVLTEDRTATITEAVTRGLISDVEMKDSGVEWLGQIPRHWVASRLKNIIQSTESGTSVNAGDWPAGADEIGVLKTSCVSAGWFNPSANKTVVDQQEIDRVTCPVKADSLIVNRANTPLLVGSAGLALIDHNNLFLSDKLWQVRFAGALAPFVYFWTQTEVYRAQIAALCVGASASMQNLAMADFRNIAIALPPLHEQRAVIEFLAERTTSIDELINKSTDLNNVLREYRSALIADAVTGNIDAQGVA